MIIVFQNHQITAVDKELLKILKCSLNDISDKISQIDLALKSIQNSKIKIENETFKVEEIKLVSIDNLTIYELTKISELSIETKPESFEENLSFPTKTEEKTETILGEFEIKPIESSENLTIQEQTPNKQENENEPIFGEFEIKPIESSENLTIQEQTPNKQENENEPIFGEFEIKPIESSENLTIQEQTPNIEKNKPLLKEEKPLEVITENEINSVQPSTTLSKSSQTNATATNLTKPLQEAQTTQAGEILITFEDEFEEIEKILSLNNTQAKQLILKDLQQAANDFEMDVEGIKELYNDLINQIETSKKDFYQAIKEKDYEAMHKIAHSLKGASLNLRVSNLAIILKTIDEKSKEKISFDKLEFLVNNFYAFVEKVKSLEINETNTEKKEIPDFLKNLILDTIKNYLSTQNEKKLKKDLKYIEKILNTKIASIEELEAIIKAEK